MSSTAILRQSLASNDLPSSSSMTTSNTISLPFTYYHNSPRKSEYNNKQNNESYVTKATNYEKISAWLNHTEILTPDEQDNNNNLQFIDEIPQQSIPSSPSEIDYQSKIIFLFFLSKKTLQYDISFFCHLYRIIYRAFAFDPISFFLNIQPVLTPNIDSYL
jgi:hypothetical protein